MGVFCYAFCYTFGKTKLKYDSFRLKWYKNILTPVGTTLAVVRQRLPLTGNICDRRLWRIKGASVGAAVDFVRRSKPHKQNRDTARRQ